jgi:hypothetical protein
MYQNRFVLCSAAALLALAVACSKSSTNPASPSSTQEGSSEAGTDGSTLKATIPSPVSPANGAQPDTLVLVGTKSAGKFTDIPLSYQFQVRSGSTVVYDSGVVGGVASGSNNVQHTPTTLLTPDTDYTWRLRAIYQGAFTSWSPDATFKSPVGGYLRNGELYDPLIGGKTVGQPFGSVTFGPEGAALDDQTSNIRYIMDQTLTSGEFSMMIKNIKSAAPGDKSKAFSMQEGFGDITDNRFRFTAEKRGSSYPNPGTVTYRIITGNAETRVFDGAKSVINFDTTRWYFWQFVWSTGTARLTVRQDSPGGPVIYNSQVATGSRDYAPTPHVAYLGAPAGRNGTIDATAPRMIFKNVWLSRNPRPAFPGE